VLEAWRAAGKTFLHRGHAIFYRDGGRGGDGPALLLIHGFPTASWDWHRVWQPLCERFARVVAPDMIGFGFSAKPHPYSYSILDQADLHEALLRELGVARVHLLAHDYGDTVAQELLARNSDGARSPELLSVCFLNGGLFPETHRARFVQRLLATRLGPAVASLMSERAFSRSFRATFGPRTKPDAEEMAAFWRLVEESEGRRVIPRLIGYMAERRHHRERWVGALRRTRLPLRVIDGAADPISGEHMVARYRELLADADTVLLPDIGHYPQVEAPRAVLDAFFAFHDARERQAR
jgi:pimeloyl-ACP methyl ester carboxylesterase